MLAKGRVRCKLGSADDDGRRSGTCHTGEKDIAAELVSGGHVFATSGLFTTYGSLESAARANKVGVWGGDAARPDDYRAQKWEEAKRDAPDGCPIKGNTKRRSPHLYFALVARLRARAHERQRRPLVLQRIRGTASRLEALRAVLRQDIPLRNEKARAPGEERGLQCVTPLRGDRWEGATLEIEFNTISPRVGKLFLRRRLRNVKEQLQWRFILDCKRLCFAMQHYCNRQLHF